uniref:Uncharacterized protein n=1 Tax=Myotis myotis TaxID=51298 RepID=A0A7J8ALT3_MYOMY|nr:hypothetical protein mMyoMyo1_007989 [Myotis myotis]
MQAQAAGCSYSFYLLACELPLVSPFSHLVYSFLFSPFTLCSVLATGSQMSKTPLPPGAQGQVGTPLKTQFSAQNLVGVTNSPQQARETGGGGKQLLRHLEDYQGQSKCLVKTALPSKGGEVLKCGWGRGARGVVWEQVRLKRKWPRPTWFCRPHKEFCFMQR